MREAHAGASRAAVSYQRAADNAPVPSATLPGWDDLPAPPTETVWCVNEDAIYAACGDRPDRMQPELLH